ncbi:MAG: tRNA pseudouridine(55) synthase TruB [Oscillospiraceae bacterium]|jgi:tRNA pseudouridine55 synthase|nr:tRNA pseudouridine(55) synthase TruB [Oscillospiraceae bacterium]
MNGIIIADKPTGWTSHDVVAKLRGALKIKRIGHGGTLDPMATGVLPIFVGRATRAAEFCENAEKEYIAGLRLGLVTDTQDVTGKTIGACDALFSRDELIDVIPGFIGAQQQIPPMYSAIKQDGKKLYELARRGHEVARPARNIFVSEIELLDGDGNEFLLRIKCSKGTYIRTLCHDIGAALGCGGTMSSLRRTMAGAFSIDTAHTLNGILDAISSCQANSIVLPIDSIFREYPQATLDDSETQKCKHGAQCKSAGLADGKYRFYAADGEFLMLGEASGGVIRTIKNFFVGW